MNHKTDGVFSNLIGCFILLMLQKSGVHQLRLVVYADGRVSDPMAKCKILGWGGVGWDVITFVALEHMVDATQQLGLVFRWKFWFWKPPNNGNCQPWTPSPANNSILC